MTADPRQQLHHGAKLEQRRRDLLAQYASDRIEGLKRRAVIYTIGAILIVIATGPVLGLSATLVLLIGEAMDCWVLRRVPPRLAQGGNLKKIRRDAVASGVFQAFTMSLATTLYVVMEGADSSIMGVVGVLGMGTVNAALILPTNPKLAIFKMGLFALTPLFLLVLQALRLGSDMALLHLEMAQLMVILSMAYMCFSFCRAGLDNFRKTEALKRSQLNLSSANETLKRHRNDLQRLSMVARSTNDAVLLTGPDKRIEWVNDAFTRHTGVPSEMVVGQPIATLVAATRADASVQDEVAEAMRQGKPLKTEIRHDQTDGRVRWSEMHMVPVRNADNYLDFYVTVVRDVTAAKNHDDSMRRARTAAEDAARAKADFLANMSHEIRTPMTGIIGMADLLSDTEQTAEQSEYTQTIIGSSRSLLTIINDILDLSKMEAGKLTINNAVFDAKDCFEETIRLLAPTARQKGLDLNLTLASDVPQFLFADDVRIRQIATNIIGNAAKFTEKGRIDVEVWTEGGTDSAPLQLHFNVKDTGIGIPETQLASIFDEFTQAETSTTRRFGGTGLGLTICRVLTDMMGGGIDVTSTYGEGSCFHVCLPVTLPAANALPQQDVAPALPAYDSLDLTDLNVLVAEDNRTNRLLISKYLGKLPINLTFANDGFEAVEATLASPPDLIFMDMSMPNMSGTEATEAIRASTVRQPVIVALTANAFENERTACMQAGMDDFLTKPIRRAELVDCLHRHVGRGRAQSSSVQSALSA